MNNKIYVDQYIMYGLNHRRSFLRLEECKECGEPPRIMLIDPQDIEDFSVETLTGYSCESCALFYVHKDETYSAYVKSVYDADEEEVTFALGKIEGKERHMFADLDGELRFCCYSLLVEVDDGMYEVIM